MTLGKREGTGRFDDQYRRSPGFERHASQYGGLVSLDVQRKDVRCGHVPFCDERCQRPNRYFAFNDLKSPLRVRLRDSRGQCRQSRTGAETRS